MKNSCLTKNFFAFAIFIFGFGFSSFSQQIELNEKEVTELLCKTWKIEYGSQGGKKIAIAGMEEALNDKYTFHPNNTYDLNSTVAENISGEWNYNSDKKLIALSMNGIYFGQIVTLNSTEMIITSSGMPNVEFHLKPTE